VKEMKSATGGLTVKHCVVLKHLIDYPLQSIFAEVIWRLYRKDGRQFIETLFGDQQVAAKFCSISVASFHQDIRSFLNEVNKRTKR